MRLRKLGIASLVKLQATLMALIGVVAGALCSFGGFIYELFTGSLNSGTALAFLALLGMPLLFAFAGYVAGLSGALLYNLFAHITGGIQIEFDTA